MRLTVVQALGAVVHRRFMRTALWLTPILVAVSPGGVQAQQQIELPLSCAIHSGSGRLLTRPAPSAVYDLVSEPERRTVTVCGPGGCRLVQLYRFDVACGDAKVSWVHLAAVLLNAEGSRVVVRNERMIARRMGWIAPPGDCADGLLATRGPGDVAERRFERRCRRSATRILPQGFAPLNELGARFIHTEAISAAASPQQTLTRPAVASPKPIPASAPKVRMAEREADAEEGEIFAPVPGNRNPHVSPVERWADPAPLRFPERQPPPKTEFVPPRPREVAEARVPVEPTPRGEPSPAIVAVEKSELAPIVETPVPAQPQATVEVAASPIGPLAPPSGIQQPDEGGGNLRLVSTAGWSPSVSYSEQRTAPTDLQLLSAFSALTTQLRGLPIEREFAILLVGLTLLWGLLSGVGWYATRARRAAVTVTFQPPESRPMAYPQPIGTALIAPADKMMCGELCKTAHTMLRQIETNVDSLQNVAPLRRVLQREMQHLEQFLTAVMTATPVESEEWRRMRNRLQRIVKELHRLKDIVDGAYRSLSGAGFSGSEPPRDKHEAYEMLGVHADISPKTLKKLVEALRACWHPDLAKDETDRAVREERMKRINIAWDILSGKRAET